MTEPITVYGTDDSDHTRRVRRHLDSLRLEYHYVNLDRDPEADRLVRQWHEGKRRVPTILLSNAGLRRRVTQPDDAELNLELDRMNLLPQNWEGDRKRVHAIHRDKHGRAA